MWSTRAGRGNFSAAGPSKCRLVSFFGMGRKTAKDLIEDCAEPKDIGPLFDLMRRAAGLLGSHVSDASLNRPIECDPALVSPVRGY